MVTPQQYVERVQNALAAGDEARAWQLARQLRQHVGSEPRLAQLWLQLLAATGDPQRLVNEARFLLGSWEHDGPILTAVYQRLADVLDQSPSDEPAHGEALARYVAETGTEAYERLQQDEPTKNSAFCYSLALNVAMAQSRLDSELRPAALEMLENAEQLASNIAGLAQVWSSRAEAFIRWGQWEQAYEACVRARELGATDRSATTTLVICAAACGNGQGSIEPWRSLGFDAQVGADQRASVADLDPVFVRLPLSSTGVQQALEQAPQFETIRVKPRSPVHGVVDTATVFDAEVDYGAVLLWDARRPIRPSRHRPKAIRYALLKVLEPSQARIFRFVAKQGQPGQLARWGKDLPGLEVICFDEQSPFVPRLITGPKSGRFKPPPAGTVHGKLVVTDPDQLVATYERLQSGLAPLAADDLMLASPDFAKAVDRDQKETTERWRRIIGLTT